jgi:hypothetical protein
MYMIKKMELSKVRQPLLYSCNLQLFYISLNYVAISTGTDVSFFRLQSPSGPIVSLKTATMQSQKVNQMATYETASTKS